MAKYVINSLQRKSTISREIYGHFSEHLGRCIYDGIFVGKDSQIPNTNGMRNDVVEALKNIRIPVLRWPGGCFADEYHWQDGIGEQANRKKMINTHWGGVVEDNSFGTHEFMELCRQLETQPYINGNVGSGTVQEMSEWVEYMTFDGLSPMSQLREQNGQKQAWTVKYFGVGNESWGCGGNMRPEYYADLYRRYQTYARNYGDNKLYRIACGANVDDYNWTEVLMRNAGRYMDGLSLHYYTMLYGPDEHYNRGSATDFNDWEYTRTMQEALRMDELLQGHGNIMDKYDPQRRVGLIVDEWGTWFDVEPGTNPGFLFQQNTMRDALVAGITLNIFNKHSHRVTMANIAQTVNVLQAVILTEGEKMLLTPTYHVFDMYQGHQGASLLNSFIEAGEMADGSLPMLHESASIDADGNILVTICNLSTDASEEIDAEFAGGFTAAAVEAEILTSEAHAHNTFDAPDMVNKAVYPDVKLNEKGFACEIPPCSVIAIKLKARA